MGQKATLEIFNLMGQLINKVELNSDKTSITISTNSLVNGLYLLKIMLNGEIISNDKIIIVK